MNKRFPPKPKDIEINFFGKDHLKLPKDARTLSSMIPNKAVHLTVSRNPGRLYEF
jgi:hypothetical protein